MKYIDRDGKVITAESSQDKLLRWLYTHRAGRKALKLLVRPWVSKLGGRVLDTGFSKCLIAPFAERNQIDLSCCKKQDFTSYNDFFTRQLGTGCRPMEGGGGILVSPCDGKLSVYPVVYNKERKSVFTIKHTQYTLESLLRSSKLAEYYNGGYACVFRLTVDDYHRYCYIDDGVKSRNYYIPGVFHTVNPSANDVVPIYKENSREYSLLKSRHFKTIVMMEVGALLVGRITNYHEECRVTRGQEKGRFEFGGSTVILLFQKDAVLMDAPLIKNTEEGCETVVKMGERIGESCL